MNASAEKLNAHIVYSYRQVDNKHLKIKVEFLLVKDYCGGSYNNQRRCCLNADWRVKVIYNGIAYSK